MTTSTLNGTTNIALSFSDEQAMLLDSAKSFCSHKSDINAVRSLLKPDSGHNPDVWQEMVALGWTGIAIPEQYGGFAMGLGSMVPVIESMGRHLLGTALITSTLAAQAILRGGSEAQREKWLPKIVAGTVGSMALLDNEDWGSKLCGVSTANSSSSDSSSKIVLSGKKLLVADATVADFFIVSINHSGNPALAIVEASQLTANAISANTLIDETKRAATVDFSGVTLSPDALLPQSEQALKDIRLIGALLIAAEATGTSAATLDCIVSYLTSRIQFGRLIGSYQSLKHPTVDILLQMDSSRSLIYHAATLLDKGPEIGPLEGDTEVACRMAKAQATETLLFAGDRAVQFHGGMGFTYDCDAMLYIRRAQWAQHQYGDAQHHRLHLARLLLD
ncbi:acyl-CoA/acyl-ACP dehydrogenase [Porticoccaceae bacterium]|nr:acyl-CoA/acyl-ACP dehydrogenase [Porticoccaceae bacterium]MDB4580854.1 acyl-CoA/acyl-ACP dehydrogenase [Porticoccaceae bacterium]MDC0517268.1 acyl-CoA/acyl-ACP dehydrogenase [Porticoccaceae bacterium]MDC0590274.1 acyl-CoA/acyl-ACP dehydrogenase [Porticoccaceae bacterium]MDC3261047.1 acyl-CoA/acyl-ACP dehydrogenase [bacterium]